MNRLSPGVFQVGSELLTLQEQAQKSELPIFKFKGEVLYNKADLIQALASSFHFPEYSALNWDALHENLRALLNTKGVILWFEYTPLFQNSASKEFNTALSILNSVSKEAQVKQTVFTVWLEKEPFKL